MKETGPLSTVCVKSARASSLGESYRSPPFTDEESENHAAGQEPEPRSCELQKPRLFLLQPNDLIWNKMMKFECAFGGSHRLVTSVGADRPRQTEQRCAQEDLQTSIQAHTDPRTPPPSPTGPQLLPTWLARSSLSVACRPLSRAATWSSTARRSRSLCRALSSCSASSAWAPLSRPSTLRRAAAPAQPRQARQARQAHSLRPESGSPSTHCRACLSEPLGDPWVWTRGEADQGGAPRGDSPLRPRWPGQGCRSGSGQAHSLPPQLLRAQESKARTPRARLTLLTLSHRLLQLPCP